jgi:hypothetical protein
MAKGVSGYFKESPFGDFAGKLSPVTGKDDFVTLEIHDRLLRKIEGNLLRSPVTIRLIVAGIGGGKTWTLSWLSRYFSEQEHTLTISIPRIELRGQPDRGFMEAVFRGLTSDISELRDRLRQQKVPKEFVGTSTHYVWMALFDEDALAVLSGGGGKLPQLAGLPPPLLTKTEGTIQLLLGLFRLLYASGFAKVVVLVDEVESLFVAYGRKDLFIFENYLRGIFDEFLSDKGQYLPRLVILLAGTTYVLEQISPALVGKQTASGDFAQALARRLEPTTFLVKEESDVLRIASHRIGKHRKRPLSQPFIPYEEEAILYVWRNSLGNIGDFCHYLQSMYELALSEKAEKITLKHAERTLEQYRVASSATSNES